MIPSPTTDLTPRPPNGAGGTSAGGSLTSSDGLPAEPLDLAAWRDELESVRRERDALRAECEALRSKVETIAQVIGAKDAGKILHDVRNVMNELVLLRKLAELDD